MNFNEQQRNALLKYDCEKSVSIILDFIKNLEVLQTFMTQGQDAEGLFMARKCCGNPIIACEMNELPTVGLKTVQGMILDKIIQLDPTFRHDAVKGLYNIATAGNCSNIINACRRAISQLHATR